METDSQIIVKLFAEKFNLKFNGRQFAQQLGMANGLLKHYSLEEIVMCINYLSLYPPKARIVSLGYFPYILNNVIVKAKYYYYNLNPVVAPPVNKTEDVKNEVKETKSLFSKNRRF